MISRWLATSRIGGVLKAATAWMTAHPEVILVGGAWASLSPAVSGSGQKTFPETGLHRCLPPGYNGTPVIGQYPAVR